MKKEEMAEHLKSAIERWRNADRAWRDSGCSREKIQEVQDARDSIVYCRDALEDSK
jgi:DNA phosphorothioation-dependent restriction protein DptG